MWFEQLIRRETGCASYIMGSQETGECAVFDPLWDIEPYHRIARHYHSRIRFTIDSHAHADHVSGNRRLAAATGADILLPSGMSAQFPFRRLYDGDEIKLGEVSLEVLHCPGHRPELINLILRDLSRSRDPWSLLSADFLLVGDIARPDLAQDGPDGAVLMYREAIPRLAELPDFVEVYPGHVAGST